MKLYKLAYIDPYLIFTQVSNMRGTIFLDSSMQNDNYGRYSYIVINPIQYFNNDNIHQDCIIWQEILTKNKIQYDNLLPPFIGGLVGYFSYDLMNKLEQVKLTSNEQIVPDYMFALYTQTFAFDHVNKITWIIVQDICIADNNLDNNISLMLDLYNNAKHNMNIKKITQNIISQLKFNSSYKDTEYLTVIDKAKNYILSGDIFEVNITQKFVAKIANDINCVDIYSKLRGANPAPFSAYINFDDLVIMSSSPERFMRIIDKEVEVRPIKGTIKRYEEYELDKIQQDKLYNSQKDRAENIMIVDLMRNDLSKICEANSVVVKQLCQVESYTNLHHLVSVITGQLKKQNSIIDALLKCFPAGSITGAPKIRAMEIIDELEPFKRGVYCGAIGYFSFNQNIDFSVAIRTIIKNKQEISFYSGGAITLDSNPQDEHNELMLKAEKLYNIFK
jgi:para-aminobenzoate synthetase component 1